MTTQWLTTSNLRRFNSVCNKVELKEGKWSTANDTVWWKDTQRLHHILKKATDVLQPHIQCANIPYSMWYSMPCQNLCITASLIILLNWVTPVWRWQMVQQNNASHFDAVQYCVTEQLSCIPSGSDPFLDTHTICTRIREFFKRDLHKWADLTSLVCFVPERYSVRVWQLLFLCNTAVDCVTDSKQYKVMVFCLIFSVVKYICYMLF